MSLDLDVLKSEISIMLLSAVACSCMVLCALVCFCTLLYAIVKFCMLLYAVVWPCMMFYAIYSVVRSCNNAFVCSCMLL